MRCAPACAVCAAIMLAVGMPLPAEAVEFLFKVGNVDVPAGTIVHGDAVAVGGRLSIAGTVEGDAVAVGGDIRVSGQVTGSVRAVRGNVTLYSTAVVGGSAAAWGGRVRTAPGALVGGSQQPSGPPPAPPPGPQLPGPVFPPAPWPPFAPGPHFWWWVWPPAALAALFQVLYWVVVLIFLAGFVVTVWVTAVLFPRAVNSLADVLERAPLAAFGVGLLGWVLLVPVAVLLTLTVVGIALVLWMPVLVFIMVQLGMTAIALLVGRRIHPAGIGLPTVIGAVILAIAFAIPHLGWLLAGVISIWGLGVVLLSLVGPRGGRPLPPPAPPAPVEGA
jgi:hypothetical protein